MIPTNATKIIELRKRGYRPNEMILVSLVGKLDELNHVIYADYRNDYEWDFLNGLDVCIFANSSVDYAKTLKAIAGAKTAFLGLWDVDRLEGADFYYLPYLAPVFKPNQKLDMRLEYNIWINMQNKMFNNQDWMRT